MKNYFIVQLLYKNIIYIKSFFYFENKMLSIETVIYIGIFIGFVVGIAFGILIGKYQKPWYELTYEEKRNRKIMIGTGLIILTIGAIIGFWQFINF